MGKKKGVGGAGITAGGDVTISGHAAIGKNIIQVIGEEKEIKIRELEKKLTCPQCGGHINFDINKCQHCKAEFFVTSLASLGSVDKSKINIYLNNYKKLLELDPNNGKYNYVLGICYLFLKSHDLAVKHFAKACEQMSDNADVYHYYALALFKGRRPKILTLSEIKQIEEYINTAIQMNDTKAKYYFLLALTKLDFYIRNGLKPTPPSHEYLFNEADSKDYENEEIERMIQILHVNDLFDM